MRFAKEPEPRHTRTARLWPANPFDHTISDELESGSNVELPRRLDKRKLCVPALKMAHPRVREKPDVATYSVTPSARTASSNHL